MCINMRRITILAVYDSRGRVYSYLEYYIRVLLETLTDLIIVVIGYMEDESINKLKKYSSEIYFKENKGYDAAAYKYVLENYLGSERLDKYDELILTNDTCFGPFVSFTDILNEMNKKDVDFWGLKYCENYITDHLQSNFLVFKKNTFCDIIQYFKNKIYNEDDKTMVCIRFEHGLFNYLLKKRFLFGYYGLPKDINNYKSPDYCLIEEHFPLMKKRCFEKNIYNHDNCTGALLYIKKNTNYDIRMILEYIKDKYDIEYNIDYEFKNHKISTKYICVKSVCKAEDIYSFCNRNNNIYIYGAGKVAAQIYGCYQDNLNNLKGFIVSNDQIKVESYLQKPVFLLSQIQDKQVGIIVGCSQDVTRKIQGNLDTYQNVLYLW